MASAIVVVWLKIRKHDILDKLTPALRGVVVWLKIRKHDITDIQNNEEENVVVWLKIRKHDIKILFHKYTY